MSLALIGDRNRSSALITSHGMYFLSTPSIEKDIHGAKVDVWTERLLGKLANVDSPGRMAVKLSCVFL